MRWRDRMRTSSHYQDEMEEQNEDQFHQFPVPGWDRGTE